MKLLFRNLEASEIKPCIAKTTENGVIVLLWKSNIADYNILDETLESTDYDISYPKENTCRIAIWDKPRKMWVAREGIGEGVSPKCKANDALKRAGMAWGIGRELFTCGELFIPKDHLQSWKESDKGRVEYHCYDEFKVLDIEYIGKTIKKLVLGIFNSGQQHNEIAFEFQVDDTESTESIVKKASRTTRSARKSSSEKTVPEESEVSSNVSEEDGEISADSDVGIVEENAKTSNDENNNSKLPKNEELNDVPEKSKENVENKPVNNVKEHQLETEKELKSSQNLNINPETGENKHTQSLEPSGNNAIDDNEIILLGNCKGKRFGEVKETPMFKSFLNWAKNAKTHYPAADVEAQFLKFKAMAGEKVSA